MTEAIQSRIDIDVRSSGADKAITSLDRLVAVEGQAQVSSDRLSKVRERNEAAVERLARRYDEEYRKLRQAEQAQKELDRARASGLAGTQAYERALAGLQKQHQLASSVMNDNTKAVGLARHEWINLSRQLQDVGVSLAGGQSLLTVAFQQGSQLLDGMATSGAGLIGALKEVGATALRVATNPITAVVAALGTAAAATYEWQKGADALTVSLNRMGASAGLMSGGAEAIASRAAHESGISVSAARGLAAQYIGAGVPGQALGGAIGITRDFGAKLGLNGEEAAAVIAGALADPTRGAEELAKKFGILSLAQREEIARTQDLGDKAGAAKELIAGVAIRLRELEDPTWSVSRAIDGLKKSALDFLGRIGRGVAGGETENEYQRQQRVASMQRAALDAGVLRQRSLDKIGEDAGLAAREIAAQTYAQRAAIIAERERLETLRDTANITKTMLTAEAERVKLLAQSQRALDDYVRAGQQERSLLGKTPFQRGLQEIENRFGDLQRQLPQRGISAPAHESIATRSARELIAEAERRGVEPTDANFQKLLADGVGGQGRFRGRLISGRSALSSATDFRADSGATIGPGALAERNAQRAAYIAEAQIAPIREANKELEAQRRALDAQQAAFGRSTAAVAKAAKEQELLNQYQREGIPITDAVRASIEQTASGYGRLSEAQERFAQNMQKLQQAMEDIRSTASGAISGFVSDLYRGSSAGEALRGVLDRIGQKALDVAATNLSESLFGVSGSKGGGLLGNLFGSGAGGLANLFSGGSGQHYFSGGSLFSGSSFQFAFPGFPDGGLVGAPARHMFRAPLSAFTNAPHFAEGGGVPAFLHPGEIVLNAAQQRNVADQMAPNITVHNYAAGVDVTPQVTPQGVALIVRSAIDANNRQNAEAAWRGNRR